MLPSHGTCSARSLLNPHPSKASAGPNPPKGQEQGGGDETFLGVTLSGSEPLKLYSQMADPAGSAHTQPRHSQWTTALPSLQVPFSHQSPGLVAHSPVNSFGGNTTEKQEAEKSN